MLNMSKVTCLIKRGLQRIQKLKVTKKSRLIGGLACLLILILSPIAFAKSSPEPKTEIAGISNLSDTTTQVALSSVEPIQPTIERHLSRAEELRARIEERRQAYLNKYPRYTPPTRTPVKTSTRTVSPRQTNTPSSIPTAVPTATPNPVPSGILGYINQARAQNGLVQLTYSSELNSAAKAKSQDMYEKNYFSHTSPDGRSDFDFIKAAGYIYRFAGSNIAKGNFTEKSVFDAWMNSPGHRANILDARAREFGYGVAGSYHTMMVGAR